MNNFVSDNLELVRVVAVGSVDDGKSTLIGRLLYDSGSIFDDQISAVERASAKQGFNGIDFSLFTDGLAAEREQKITIDVAYRYFSTANRRFIIADVPGHEQYTRNMITGASTADLALVLVDATVGATTQTRRHLFIASLLGIPNILVVVNKMDVCGYSSVFFEKIKNQISEFVLQLDIKDLQFIPVSATAGDMVVTRGGNLSWYRGITLLDYLDSVRLVGGKNLVDFRFPVQLVTKGITASRGYAGMVESGIVRKGDEILALPSREQASVKSIFVGGEQSDEAFSGQNLILELDREIDLSRGDMVVRPGNVPEAGNRFEAVVCWFGNRPFVPGISYILKQTTRVTRGYVEALRYRINIDTQHREKVEDLGFNQIGRVYFKSTEVLCFDSFAKNRNSGNFIIVDEVTCETVGAGMIIRKLQPISDGVEGRKAVISKGAVLWFTGLPGSGKTTIANAIKTKLLKLGVEIEWLDDDLLRKSMKEDLGGSAYDLGKNIERAGFIANLLSKHKVIVLASFISPYQRQREGLKESCDNFVEIFVNTPLEICERRSPDKVSLFVESNNVYEPPIFPDLELKTDQESLAECVEKVLTYLYENNYLA